MAPSATSLLVAGALFAAAASLCEANMFLEPLPPAHQVLLEDLERALGGEHRVRVEAKVQELEEAMLPTFRALPREAGDRLTPGAVRYLLHRFFLARHNWGVFGIGSTGDAWDAASAASAFSAHSREVEAVFEHRLAGSGGMTLRETAMLAATLESLVHEESMDRLRGAYRLAGLSPENGTLTEREAQLVVDTFMLVYLKRIDHASASPREAMSLLRRGAELTPYWPATLQWLREVRQEAVADSGLESRTSFEATALVADKVMGQYGWYANEECREFKDDLTQYERGNSGRVPLAAFYGAALNHGSWQFSESADYLRANGALDESDPGHPSVIIANYMAMSSNCVAGSSYYTVCCTNECEDLLGHVERQVRAPEASPAQLVEIVSNLPSASVQAPRALPAALVDRLEAVAAEHGGTVPLHGRLFSQWLHAAYPRECPFPHLAGATKTELLQIHEWEDATGLPATLNETEMRSYVAGLTALPSPVAEAWHQWQPEEELFFESPKYRYSSFRPLFRRVASLAVAASVALALAKVVGGARQGVRRPSAKGKLSEFV